MKVRYIRDYSNGSNVNWACVWQEIEAYSNGINVALGKTNITASGIHSGGNLQMLTDGIINGTEYVWIQRATEWVQIDLEQVYDIETIKVWHYYNDARIFYGTKTEVSENGTDWTTVFDSAESGTYTEAIEGHSIYLMKDLGLQTEPKVTSISIDKPIMSDEEGFNKGNVRFTFDQDVIAYSVKCVGTSHNTGRNVEENDKYVSTQANNYTVAEASLISVREFEVIPADTLISAEITYTELYQEGENRVNIYGENEERIWSTYNQQQEVVITNENINFVGKSKADGDSTRRVDYYITSSDQILPTVYGTVNEVSNADYQALQDFNDGLGVSYTSSSGLTKVQYMLSFQIANMTNVKSVTFQIVGQFDQPFRADFYNVNTGSWDSATRINFDGYTMGVYEKKLELLNAYHDNGLFRICVQGVLSGEFGIDYANFIIEREVVS